MMRYAMKRNATGIILLVFVLLSCLERTDLIVDETIESDSSGGREETEGIIPRDTLIRQGGWEKVSMSPLDRRTLYFYEDILKITTVGSKGTTQYGKWEIIGDTVYAWIDPASPIRSFCMQFAFFPSAASADTGCLGDQICKPDTLRARDCSSEQWESYVYEWQEGM
jgi:hypothetical protein